MDRRFAMLGRASAHLALSRLRMARALRRRLAAMLKGRLPVVQNGGAYRLAVANHRLERANDRLPGANHRLVGANEGAMRACR